MSRYHAPAVTRGKLFFVTMKFYMNSIVNPVNCNRKRITEYHILTVT